MAQYLFSSLASQGFISVALGIAMELARLGHRCNFLTSPQWGNLVEEAGFLFVPCDPRHAVGFNVATWAEPEMVAKQAEAANEAIRRVDPDVVISDTLLLGPILAARHQSRRVAVIGLGAYILPTSADASSEALGNFAALRYWRAESMLGAYRGAQKYLKDIDDPSADVLHGDLYLLRSVPEFEGEIEHLPAQIRFIGACLSPLGQLPEPLIQWLGNAHEASREIAYLHINRISGNFVERTLDVLRGRGFSIVTALPEQGRVRRSADTDIFLGRRIPMEVILPHASLAVSTGHTTNVLGAIVHGLPQLIIDRGSGAEELGLRCKRAGCGIWLPRRDDLSIATIDEAVGNLIGDESFGTGARKMQEAFRRVDSFAVAAVLLDKLAAGRLDR